MAAGMYGAEHFKLESFEPDTSNSVLLGILLHDVNNSHSLANPASGAIRRSPIWIFSENACHGGAFRAPYKINSVTEVAAVVYAVQSPPVYVSIAVGAVLGSRWVLHAEFVPFLKLFQFRYIRHWASKL
eukprot:m.167045 g.167045  ORF g.167045 m.167045 type:complete len:129 (+) comp15300_c0_seq6:1340-1726(+)